MQELVQVFRKVEGRRHGLAGVWRSIIMKWWEVGWRRVVGESTVDWEKREEKNSGNSTCVEAETVR